MFISLGTLRLFKYELVVQAYDLVIKIKFLQPRNNVMTKEKSNCNGLDQITEQNSTKT